MKEKIIETKFILILYLVSAILNFLMYRECFGNHNQYPTLWLVISIVGFCMFIIYGVKIEILRNKL